MFRINTIVNPMSFGVNSIKKSLILMILVLILVFLVLIVYTKYSIFKEEVLMQADALKKIVLDINRMKTETQNIELKAASKGCPTRLFVHFRHFLIRMKAALSYLVLMSVTVMRLMAYMMLRIYKRK